MSELRKLIYNSLVYIVEPSIKGKDLDKIVEGIVKGIRELMSKKKDLMKFVPDVYADVFPLCIDVKGYTKDNRIYNLEQERGENLAKAIRADMLKRLEG